MKYSFSLLAVSAAVFASPLGVTKAIAPSGAAPAGCSPNFPGSFGLAVSNIGKHISGRQAVSQLSDGQIQAPTSTKATTTSSARIITQISDGQIQAPTSASPVTSSTSIKSSSSSTSSGRVVTQISDGQIQAPTSAQPATSSTSIKSSSSSKASTSSSTSSARVVTQISDGQIQAPTSARPVTSSSKASSISLTIVPVISQIGDGQIQNPRPVSSSTGATTTSPVVVPQTSTKASTSTKPMTASTSAKTSSKFTSSTKPASSTKVSSSSKPASSSKTTSSSKAVSTKPASSKVSSSSLATSARSSSRTLVPPVSVISDGQPQAPTVVALPDGQVNVSPNGLGACATNGTLTLTLSNGVLKDARGWTGYIASNRQFQFDNPPQSGAIYTSGFSVCSNGSLALGGSAVFWECLSGGFYNLYDQWIAPQCSPITLNVARLVQC